MNDKRKTVLAYVGILCVVFIWAVVPLFKKILIGDSFSASIYTVGTSFVAFLSLLWLNRKHLRSLNADYFKAAIPTGFCLCLASFSQALAYVFNASPTNQAFLENLSCVIVPVILFVFIRKKPTLLTVSASLVCLVSSLVLAGGFETGVRFHVSDILNALAGLLYGVNIAVTGICAKKLIPSLYVMLQMMMQSVLSLVMAIAFHFISVGGKPIDPFVFRWELLPLLGLVVIGIVSNSVCWTIRTSAMKYVSASSVAIIMPFSAVVTGALAVLIGQDQPSLSLLLGAALGFAAALMSSFDDLRG